MTLYKNESQRVPSAEPESAVSNTHLVSVAAASFVRQQYEFAKRHRQTHDDRWLRYFNQFRGRYSSEEMDMLRRIREKNPFASEAFIKVTKTKALAAYGSLIEVLTAGNQFPIALQETPEPEGIAKTIYASNEEDANPIDDLASAVGFNGDGRELPAGTTFRDLLGGLGKTYSRIFKGGKFVIGEAPNPMEQVELRPAKSAAERMNSVLQDQLMENDTISCIESCLWEAVIMGTGAIKGPFTFKEMIPRWETDEENPDAVPKYVPTYKLRPYITAPSIWSLYPDPYAKCSEELEFVIERHKLARSEVQKLIAQPGFNAEHITIALRGGGMADYETWEANLRDTYNITEDTRYEVLEFWGNIPAELARRIGLSVDPELPDNFSVSACLWELNGLCIKAELNPLIPQRIPYLFVPYEEHKYQLWGIGVPENMDDAQRMINVHTRAAQDNLRLAGSVMLEVNENQLVPGQDNTIYAGKVWRKQGGAPGQSIYPISFNNTAPQHLQFIGEANRMADQASGIPSVMHGQTGVSGTGRTATTMSMIMNGGNLSVRTVMKIIDRRLLKPLGQAMFNWNMQCNTDIPQIRGDMKIIATGTSALAQREVQSQRLLTLLQILSNPALAPYGNMAYIIRELAKTLDLNPDDVINDVDTIKLYMQLQQGGPNVQPAAGQEAQQGDIPPGAGGPGGMVPNAGADNRGGAGGGNIGIDSSAVTGQASVG